MRRFPVARGGKRLNLDRRLDESKREIADRSGARDMINEPWEQLFSIFNAIDEKVYVADPDSYEILYANPAKKRVFGENIVGQKCHRAFQGLDEPCDFCTNPLIFGENLGKTKIWEFQNRKTGNWLRCIDRAILWSDGRMVRFEMAIDIHKRKVIEDALRSSEEKYRNMVENINEVIYSTDRDGIVTYVSPAIESLTGYTSSEVVGRHFSEFIHSEDVENVVDRHAQVLLGQQRPTEYRLLKKFGGYCWVQTFSKPISSGAEAVGLQGVISDLTAQKEVEVELKESEQRYRELLATMNEGFRMVDENGIVTYVNEKLCSMLGYEAHEIIGRHVVDFLNEGDGSLWEQQFEKRKKADSTSYEIRHRTKTGNEVKTLVSPKPVFDDGGRFKGSFSVITDITALKKVEEELKQREKELNIKTLHLEEMNAALRVLLEKREMDKRELEEKVLLNIEELVKPYIDKLRRVVESTEQKMYLDIIDTNLEDVTSSFSHFLHFHYKTLTPTEVQIARLIRDGTSTKEIANLMNLSDRTIESHRKNLRRKLGLKDKKVNLRSTLLAIN
jgi:PAS domain S-box-containing protein